MTTEEVLIKIKRIEIKSKLLSKHLISGDYHTFFKGQGMSFSEVRNYQYGDEIRKIDWNVTARYHHPFVKLFEEEREQNVFLLIDVSNSMFTGSKNSLKINFLLELVAVLAFSAEWNKDKVSSVFFSSKIEKYFPPSLGKKHLLKILSSLINQTTTNQGTNPEVAFDFLQKVIKKRSVVFVISDFITDSSYFDSLRKFRRKHDVILIKIEDVLDKQFPKIGKIQCNSVEFPYSFWIDTNDETTQEMLSKAYTSNHIEWEDFLKKEKISFLTIENQSNYIPQLINFFAQRRR
ncbi:MAG: DUF58 domain-containing protein [Flavobacteriia bacterium]|nr:DUF58 domain-containing protein [Flavobacteriia bacterium]